MTPAGSYPDTDEDELEEPRFLGPSGALEELHDEPFEIDVGEDEAVGLDAGTFDEELYDPGDDLVGPVISTGGRFDEQPLELDLDDEGLLGSHAEYGLCDDVEADPALEDDFEPLAGQDVGDEDGGEDGLAGDDGTLDLAELPPLREPSLGDDLDEPVEPVDLDLLD